MTLQLPLYTNIPHEEDLTTVCIHTKIFMEGKPIYLPPGVLPYISHIGMYRHQRVGFLRRCGLKTGIDFAYLGLGLGMVFEETYGSLSCPYCEKVPV